MKKEHHDIRRLIKFDPLHEAELITGTDYKTNEATAWLGMNLQMAKSNQLQSLLESIGDTTFSNTLVKYISIITKFGFYKIYEADFNYENKKEKHFIFWHSELSILLNFDTFSWEGQEPNVNSGNIYYNWSPNCGDWASGVTSSGAFFSEKNTPHLTMWDKNFISPYYIPNYPILPKWESEMPYEEYKRLCAPIERMQQNMWKNAIAEGKRIVWRGDHDCREALITNIKAMFETGIFLKEWKDCPFPWLTNYADHKNTSYHDFTSHYEKTKSIINTFPADVKKAIGEYKK